MSNVEVVKARVDDLDLVPDLPFGDKTALLNGPAYSLFVNGDHLAIGGVQLIWAGLGEAWVFVKPDAWRLKKIVFRKIKDYLDMIMNEHQLHRIQILVLQGHEQGERMARHLGFEHEGLQRQYGSLRESFNRYARIN